MTSARTKILLSTIIIIFSINLSRFFYWQVIRRNDLKKQQLSQNYKITKIEPIRGKILSQDQYPLVLNQDKYQLSIYKPDLKSPISTIIKTLGQLKPDLAIKYFSQLSNFDNNSEQKWITLSEDFGSEDISKLDIPGIVLQKVNRRFYPQGKLLRQTLGNISLSGLESYYNQQLIGRTGFLWTPKDAIGNPILTQKSWQIDSIDGRSLHLNINRSVQFLIETKLAEGINKFQADWGSVIVLDSPTGKILGISSQEATSSNQIAPRNIAISDLFEPGSIFKPLVVAMALDSNVIDQDYTCQSCDQPKVIGDNTINNWDFNLHPNSTLKDIIKNSDNIGMASIIEILGLEKFTNYFHRLGLDQKTNIDLPGEARPISKNYWSPIDLATASFGQGFAISQIQMVTAFNSLANDGVLVLPKVVDYLSQSDQVIYPKMTLSKKIFDQKTTSLIKSILKYSVDNGAIAKLKPDNLDVCAKSGTAQVAIKGGYLDTTTNASYVGFSPCDHPKITMIVTLHNPKASSWGSSTAAPIWFEITDSIIKLL